MSREKLAQVALEQGLGTIVLLEGKAPEQLNDLPIEIKGNIDAPSRFLKGRFEEFSNSKNHCMVSKTDGVITLHLNEKSPIDKYTIKGKIEIAKKFKSLGINDENVSYTPEQLANKFKLLRSLFASNLEHTNICSTLRNLKAKINRELENSDDKKGNVTKNFQQSVESNMPDSITLKLPLLEGELPVEIELNVVLEAENGSSIKCYLESIDAADLIEQQFEDRVNEEVEYLKEFVTIIEY